MAKKKKSDGITLDIKPMEQKIMQLHYPPLVASRNLREMLKNLQEEEGVSQELIFIYEDIANIVDWAIKRMRILPPPQKEGEKTEEVKEKEEKSEESEK